MTEYRSNDRGDRNDRNDRGGDRGERGGNRNRRFVSRPKFCQFCSDKKLAIDYKSVELLGRFINETGKIRPRRQTGTCARHQREVAKAIKNARHIALLPFEGDFWVENI
ncbi:MAG: 30S ribosomal protein S18 [Chloroflexi bacterium]|jgi:small subunit ribosomal protein S18|nr:30S ribosomal protein S18 [Chloroflexota bacterium]